MTVSYSPLSPRTGRLQAEKKGFSQPFGTLTKVNTPSELRVKKTLREVNLG